MLNNIFLKFSEYALLRNGEHPFSNKYGATGYERYFENNEENRTIWSENSVRQVLRSPIYAGNLVGYKRIAANMKSKKRPSTLPEEWKIVPNTHEGIVTQAEFDMVQKLMTSRRKTASTGFDNIFAGIVKCADCGYHLGTASANRRKRPELIDCIVYSCGNYTRYGNVSCSSHTIEAELLAKGRNDTGIVDFISLIKGYQGITELTATIVNTLIDKITVQERTKDENGDVKQRITIYYKFVGSLNEFYILAPTKRWTALAVKKCKVCGAEYIPGSAVSKYCPACSERTHKEQSNESKRRSRAKANAGAEPKQNRVSHNNDRKINKFVL